MLVQKITYENAHLLFRTVLYQPVMMYLGMPILYVKVCCFSFCSISKKTYFVEHVACLQ